MVELIDDSALRRLAEQQHGVVSVEQASRLGFGKDTRRVLVDGRRWERRSGLVYRLVGSTDTERQRLMEAVLSAGPGAALSGETAAAFWGVRGAVIEPIQVVRPRDHADRGGRGTRHEPTLLPLTHVVELEGIPVVTPARALFDVAGSQKRGAELQWWVDRVERLINNAITDRLVDGASLHAMLREIAQRGRPGIRVMRQILTKIGPDYVAPASGLETRIVQLCERVGLSPLRRQVNLGDGERWIGRVDFVAPDVPFVLEAQSERFHTSDLDRQLDGTRIARLEAAGYVVGQVWDEDIWYRPDKVIGTILEGTRKAATRLRTSASALAAAA
jgi:very-short-patch-repair endonuclease